MANKQFNKNTKAETTRKEFVADRGKKPNRNQRKRKGSKQDKVSSDTAYETTPGTNDVSIHTGDAKILHDSANISWSYSTGSTIYFKSQACRDVAYGRSADAASIALPGIICERDVPCVGVDAYYFPDVNGGSKPSPINLAVNALLTKMRSLARLRNTYDAPDVGVLMTAMGNIYAGIAWAKRLYATNNMYTYMNRYLPDALFAVQHIDPTPLQKDSFAFLSRLNRLITIANTIYIPNRMKWFEYLTTRYSNYYTEGTSIKDQIYVIAPAMLGQYVTTALATKYSGAVAPCFITPRDEDSIPSLGLTIPLNVKYGTVNATTDELLDAIEGMLMAVINDSDVPDITGDMENAFGQSERYIIAPLASDIMAVPLYDEEMLETFMNSRASRVARNNFTSYDSSNYITDAGPFWTIQDPTNNRISTKCSILNVASTDPYYHAYRAESMSTWFLNIHKDPSPEKTVAITRNMNRPLAIFTNSENDNINATVRAAGSILIGYDVAKIDASGSIEVVPIVNDVFTSATIYDNNYLFSFHYRPIQRFLNASRLTELGYSGELDIIAFLNDSDAEELDRIDLMRMFGAYDNLK